RRIACVLCNAINGVQRYRRMQCVSTIKCIGISKRSRSAGVYPPLMPTIKVGATLLKVAERPNLRVIILMSL
ncbi:MAG: hypothetical protein AAB332_02255, partial [Planctomycetota bacterium]